MSYFILQSLALLLLSYLVGCCLGCLAHRLWGHDALDVEARPTAPAARTALPDPASASAARSSEPLSDVVVRPRVPADATPGDAGRFGRVFEPQKAPAAPALESASQVRIEKRPQVAVPPVQSPPPPAPAILTEPAAAVPAPQPTVRVAAPPAEAPQAAVPRTAVKPAAPAVSAKAAVTGAAATAATAAGPAEDLKRIKGIGVEFEQRLHALGVRRFAQISAWTSADVARFNRELDLHGRIQHDNWIEQAQILAKGGETAFSRRVDRREVTAMPGSTWSPVAPVQVERQGTVTKDAGGPAIARGNDAATAAAAAAASAAAIAAASARRANAQPAAAGAPQPSGGALPVAFGAAGPAAVAAPTAVPADDLKRIRGITPEIERALHDAGVRRYQQIAALLPADIQRLSDAIGLHGRIERENWIDQAAVLARGGETEFARRMRLAAAEREQTRSAPPQRAAPAAPVDVSIASIPVPGATSGPVRGAAPDDLKRIRGISLVIEKKLARMGVASYAQIAAWSRSDIERISESLGVKGNIERERWIEQAQILAGGGQTDFSKRVDRGVVTSSRDPGRQE
jgi:predicted flap endonuclease-1-like 5' DNA nuclease